MSIFGNAAKSAAHIVKGLHVDQGMAQALSAIPLADQRQAFIAVMLATASHAGNKPNFNLELEVNDLWVRLNSLKAEAGGGDALGAVSKTFGALQQMNAHLTQALSTIVRQTTSR